MYNILWFFWMLDARLTHFFFPCASSLLFYPTLLFDVKIYYYATTSTSSTTSASAWYQNIKIWYLFGAFGTKLALK